MLLLSTEEKLALLLNVLGQEATDAALKSMNPTRGNFVKKILEEYKVDPPSQSEIDYIVKDFSSYFSFAIDTLGPQIQTIAEKNAQPITSSESTSAAAGSSTGSKPQPTYFETITPSGDIGADLNRLDSFQISEVLKNDHPKTVALVLARLSNRLAAAVIESLPAEIRNPTFVFLSQESTVSPRIVDQVLESTFASANAVRMKMPEIDQSQTMADLMRTLSKDVRKELLEKIAEDNAELAAQIQSKLYVFDDMLRLGDRDVQKVLGAAVMDKLGFALQNVDPELKAKVLDNMSKRARQSIEEEMEYMNDVAEEEIESAQAQFAAVIAKLDDEGEISLK